MPGASGGPLPQASQPDDADWRKPDDGRPCWHRVSSLVDVRTQLTRCPVLPSPQFGIGRAPIWRIKSPPPIPDSMAAAGLLIGTTSFLPVPVPHASARLVAAAAARPLCRRQAACMLAVDDEFDYVIVGGGTAGCVLANRLSADERTRVLLLEPGPSARGALKVAVPVALVKLFNSKWD